MAALSAHGWPGNIRELQNAIERAVILGNETITPADLPAVMTKRGGSGLKDGEGGLKELEREAILKTLGKTAGNRRQAAQELGISRRTLQYRLKEYGLLDKDE